MDDFFPFPPLFGALNSPHPYPPVALLLSWSTGCFAAYQHLALSWLAGCRPEDSRSSGSSGSCLLSLLWNFYTFSSSSSVKHSSPLCLLSSERMLVKNKQQRTRTCECVHCPLVTHSPETRALYLILSLPICVSTPNSLSAALPGYLSFSASLPPFYLGT